MKNIAKIVLASALGGALTLGSYQVFFDYEPQTIFEQAPAPVTRTVAISEEVKGGFVEAAEASVNSVVHVKTAVEARNPYGNSTLEFFFGQQRGAQPRLQMGTGSGVIISEDGYVVTNNHVIDNAREIQVSLNNGDEYTAKVVGTDPTTDIALIKIDASDLPYMVFSNSDDVRLGEWVLAVGNPFNLTSTVTAGIVSAKSRSIGIINERSAIESFIQTDAAVNRGNSGGALVNAQGKLIGINSAISTHTGSFEGYSFAVPSNIVKKVVEDLLEYGTVQRAFIGINIADVSQALAEQQDLETNNGVYVGGLTPNGAAEDAGIEEGDVIVAVDDREVSKSSELQELIGRKRPGDKVNLTINRNGDIKNISVKLRNMSGTTEIVRKPNKESFMARLGAELVPVESDLKDRLGIDYGMIVEDAGHGLLAEQGIPEGFIITRIGRKPIRSEADVDAAVKNYREEEPVVIEGYSPNGRYKYYAFGY